jgi:hypothetical protein
MLSTAVEVQPFVRDFLRPDEVMEKLQNPLQSELFVNEYVAGNDLYSHHDNRTTYDKCIIGVSLLSDVEMEFSQGKKHILIPIPRRSLYLMTGKSRYVYKHGIPSVTETRLSLAQPDSEGLTLMIVTLSCDKVTQDVFRRSSTRGPHIHWLRYRRFRLDLALCSN